MGLTLRTLVNILVVPICAAGLVLLAIWYHTPSRWITIPNAYVLKVKGFDGGHRVLVDVRDCCDDSNGVSCSLLLSINGLSLTTQLSKSSALSLQPPPSPPGPSSQQPEISEAVEALFNRKEITPSENWTEQAIQQLEQFIACASACPQSRDNCERNLNVLDVQPWQLATRPSLAAPVHVNAIWIGICAMTWFVVRSAIRQHR